MAVGKEYQRYEEIITEIAEEEAQDIIDPEVPDPEQEDVKELRYRLLRRVLGAIAADKTVKGLTPAHFGGNTEAMLEVTRALKGAERRNSAI